MNKVMEKVPVTKTEQTTPVHRVWNPFEGLREEMNRLFRHYEPDLWRVPETMGNWAMEPLWGRGTMGMTPATDVTRKDDHYEVVMELPGLEAKDVEVTYQDGMLMVRGEKKAETEETKKGVLVAERRYGEYERRFALPDRVDPEGIVADFGKGVLKIRLPIRPEAQAEQRKIKVKAA